MYGERKRVEVVGLKGDFAELLKALNIQLHIPGFVSAFLCS